MEDKKITRSKKNLQTADGFYCLQEVGKYYFWNPPIKPSLKTIRNRIKIKNKLFSLKSNRVLSLKSNRKKNKKKMLLPLKKSPKPIYNTS